MKIKYLLIFSILFCSCKHGTKEKSTTVIPVETTENSKLTLIDTLFQKEKLLGDSLCKLAESRNTEPVSKADLDEVNIHFTFRGAYINPILLNEFIPWASDKKDAIMTIDIAPYNTGSNRYFCESAPFKTSEDYVRLEVKNPDGNGTDYYSYKWLGMLNNKVHVLKFINDGTGFSGVFPSLLFVRFEVKKHLSYGMYYNQLLMHNVSVYQMGDRVKYNVQLFKSANQVKLSYIDENGKSVSEIIKPQ